MQPRQRVQRPPKITRLTNRRNGLNQHKYRARFCIRGKQNPIQITRWAESEAEILREVALMRGETVSQETHGLTWEEGYKIWWEKAGRRMNHSYQRDYELIVTQFTREKYEVLAIAKGGENGGRNGGHKKKTVTHDGWGLAAKTPIAGTSLKTVSDFMDWRRDQRVDEIQKRGGEIGKTTGNAAANKARMILFALARTLKKEGVIPDREYEFERAEKRAWSRKRSQALDLKLLGEYLDALPPQAALPVKWMLFTGWRSSTACELAEKNIDEKNNVAVGHTKSRGMHERRERREPLDYNLLSIIRQARELKKEMEIENEFLFVNTEGVRWNKDSLYQRCADCWKSAGLPHRKIHELRTTFGTLAHEKFSPAKVQKALGHDDPKSTERYKDASKIDFADVSKAVRYQLSANLLQPVAKSDETTRSEKQSEEVTIICPELGAKCLLSKEKALKLFGLKA